MELREATMVDANASREAAPPGFDADWQAPPPGVAVGVGDVLAVTVIERDGLNVFPAGADGASSLQGLVVDQTGSIRLPFAGTIQVAGLSPTDVRNRVLQRLRRVLLGAEVIVTVTDRRSQMVSIQGDVIRPGVLPLAPEAYHLISILGIAGPNPANIELSTVTVRRGLRSATIRLSDLYDRPENDIGLRGGDAVILRNVTAMVNVLGAAGLQGRIRISKRNYSVIDAVGDAKGLNDNAANPGAVYLMRFSERAESPGGMPRVYHFDFRNPAQFAVASAFVVRDGDAVLISDAPSAQVHKALSSFSGILNTTHTATVMAP
jgi:polysaccharide export outer membrane protein